MLAVGNFFHLRSAECVIWIALEACLGIALSIFIITSLVIMRILCVSYVVLFARWEISSFPTRKVKNMSEITSKQ